MRSGWQGRWPLRGHWREGHLSATRRGRSRRDVAWADQVVGEHGRVNLVVNNAGVAVAGTVEETSLDDFEWLMNINFWGVVYGTKAFLPHLKASGEGHIVNLSSVFGLVIIPAQSAYNSANSACAGSPTRCAWNSTWSSAACRPPRSTQAGSERTSPAMRG